MIPFCLRRFTAVFALAASGAAFALTRAASAQKITHDITYTSAGMPAEQGDLYLPEGAGPFPVILYLHGGSWRSGGKGGFSKLAKDLAGHGYAGFSINYDLKPHSYPTSWNESRTALEFLRAHATEYNLDPGKMIVAGTSAGGELAALLALAPEGPSAGSDHTPLPVSAAIILNGVFDLQSDVHVITRYLGTRCGKASEVCAEASPQQHVHAGAPPFFVGHGTTDHVVDYAEAQAFIASLKNAAVPVTPFVAEDGPHMYWEKSKFYAPNLAAVEAFLAQAVPGK